MTQVAALFIDPKGVYPTLVDADNCWALDRDARTYAGPHPVVAHPPCARWCRLAQSVYARTRKEEHRPGNDGGCFAAALHAVRRYGGVLEHPAGSHAWAHFKLAAPTAAIGWLELYRQPGGVGPKEFQGWGCEVWQSAYGHKARKRTWLLYCGKRPPFELRWSRTPGTHVVAGDSCKRRAQGAAALPRLTGKQNLATPEAFARVLIDLAIWSRGAP